MSEANKTIRGQREIVKKEHVNGGDGYILVESIINDEQKGPNCRMYSQVTLKPGCEIGAHDHVGESETYYILEGTGMYQDNDEKYQVTAGDALYCKDGTHGLKNTGDTDLVFMALILTNLD